MPVTFINNSNLPAPGTDAYKQAQEGTGVGNFDPKTGSLTTTPIVPGSPLAAMTAAPNSPKNMPSSSATAPLAANGAQAINSTTQPPPASPIDNTATSLASAYSSQGVNITADAIQKWIDAGFDPKEAAAQAAQYYQTNQERQRRLNEQQSSFNADLAEKNAQYAAASTKLVAEREKAVHAGVAQAAKAGMFEDQGSDQVAYGNSIAKEYDNLQLELDAQAHAAQAALESGNYKAVAEINANMDSLLQNGLQSIATRQSTSTQQGIQQKQFAQTEQDKAATLYRDTLTNLPLTTADQLSTLPSDIGDMSPAQLSQFRSSTAYQQGHAAGLSDQAILTDLKGLSETGNFKQQTVNLNEQKAQTAATLATARLAISQANLADKQAGAIDAATIASTDVGKNFLAAVQVAAPGHNKQENSDILSSLAQFTQSGQTEYAKQALTNYVFSNQPQSTKTIIGGLQQVSQYAASLKSKILALSPDQQTGFWNGNFQDIAAKFGQNPNPQLAEIGAEMGHLALLYKANVFGKRALVSSDASLKNLFPAITDTASLNFSTLNGMLDTANATLNSTVSSTIGDDLFQKIYGTGGVIGSAKSTTPPLTAKVPQGSTAGYSPSTGHWYAKDASGKVTQIQ